MLDRADTVYSPERRVLAIVEELTATLRLGGITDPRRVATDVIASLLDVPRSWPVANRESGIDAATASRARSAAARLVAGAPFAYAVGNAAFRHLSLSVDERVLIPRPETEVLVDEVLRIATERFGDSWGVAVDVGTGSGAIALSLALEGRFERVIATDASRDALAIAGRNLARLGNAASIVELREGSLFAPLAGVSANVVVSNPPYVAFGEMEALPRSVRDWEPALALFSGHDGMSATAGIVRGAAAVLEPGGLLALEVDERRASLVAEMIMRHGAYAGVGVRLDLAGRERFVLATRQ